MNEKIQEEITSSILEDMFECNLKQLRDLHLAYCLNMHFSLQQVTKQDLSKEIMLKHKELTKKFTSYSIPYMKREKEE